MSRNMLATLGPNMSSLVSVSELVLDGNQLEGLPAEMASLRMLASLSLKDNSIQKCKVHGVKG